MSLFDDYEPRAGETAPVVSEAKNRISLHFPGANVQSEMDPRAPEKLILGYTRTMMDFLRFHPQPRIVGMIGLGGGSLVKHCRHILPDARIEVAEISSEVIALRNRFHIPADDSHLAVYCADGADFIKAHPEHFDVILVDGFDSKGQPPQLCTQEFYDDCYQALTTDGMLVINVCTGRESVLISRLRRSFSNRTLVVGGEESDNAIAFAAKGKIETKTIKPFPVRRRR